MPMIKGSVREPFSERAQAVGRPRHGSVTCVSPAGLHRMAYTEWGDADNPNVVVCVHGLTRVGQDFEALAQVLATDFRVVCPDVVGRGRSSWLKNPMLYGVPQYTSDMVALIARLNVTQVFWVGTSMGGLIGMSLAALEGSPVSRLVLNDVGAVLSGAALGRIARYVGVTTEFRDRRQAHAALRDIFAGFGPHTESEWAQLLDVMLVPVANSERVRLHYDPAIAEPFRQTYGSNATSDRAVPDLELWPLYDAIRCPTLVLRGQQSDLVSAQVIAQMRERGPRAQAVELPGIGHAPTLMHDDQIRIVTNFLRAPGAA